MMTKDEDSPSSSSLLQSIITQVQNNTPFLTTINLPSQNLTDNDLIPLFQSLASNTHITTLSLPNNQITNEGCSALSSTLLDNTKLSTIDISGNIHIGSSGIEDLSKALPYNYTLKSLHMCNIGHNFGPQGAYTIALALTQNESLMELVLDGNNIGNIIINNNNNNTDYDGNNDIGAVNLFRVLNSDNTTLERLSLQNNGIGDVGANALANALLDNERLIYVDLSWNRITNRGAHDILKVLDVNDTLETLILEGNEEIDRGILVRRVGVRAKRRRRRRRVRTKVVVRVKVVKVVMVVGVEVVVVASRRERRDL